MGAAAPARAPFPPQPPDDGSSLPPVLAEKLEEFEQWARDNERESRRDVISFWALKTPAIVISAGSGLITLVGNQVLTAATGVFASILVLIDGLRPRGQLRNAHRLALYDLRAFQNRIVTLWQAGILEGKERNALIANLGSASPSRWTSASVSVR